MKFRDFLKRMDEAGVPAGPNPQAGDHSEQIRQLVPLVQSLGKLVPQIHRLLEAVEYEHGQQNPGSALGEYLENGLDAIYNIQRLTEDHLSNDFIHVVTAYLPQNVTQTSQLRR